MKQQAAGCGLCCRECAGCRPAAGLALWGQLLLQWEAYKRWLDLTVTRCALLGARVAAARQLAEPLPLSSGGGGGGGSASASSVPYLRNKGLMVFRWETAGGEGGASPAGGTVRADSTSAAGGALHCHSAAMMACCYSERAVIANAGCTVAARWLCATRP